MNVARDVPGLPARGELESLVRRAFETSEAAEIEIILSASRKALTRFARSAITQNVVSTETEVTVRALSGQRSGRASTDSLTPGALARAVREATDAARLATEDPEAQPLLRGPLSYRKVDAFDARTAAWDPDQRASAVSRLVEACRRADVRAAGSISSEGRVLALYNTAGIDAYQNLSGATVSLTASTDSSTGWAEHSGKSAEAVALEALAETAIRKALSARDPATPEPGEYEVVLEPAAVTDFLLFMGAMGLGGLPWLEGRSLFSDRLGEKIFSENFTLCDDAYHPMTVGIPFDFEGSPRQAVTLVERGVAKSVVHDRRTARRAQTETTGHALPLPNTSGPLPLNLALAGGDASLDDLIASTRKGLLVTRFHYTNVLDPKALVLTGMTRFGTFLIENGRVGRAVQNLRFTDGLERILSHVDGLTRDRRYCASFFGGGYVVPGMKLARLAFTSGTGF